MDDLDQFDGLANETAADPSGSSVPSADDATDPDSAESSAPAGEGDQGEEGDEPPKAVAYERFKDVTDRLRQQEARVDELMRIILSARTAPAGGEDGAPSIDPDVKASVKPILDERLGEYDEVLRAHRHEQSMAQLEELSPGIGKMWPQIKAEFNKLPASVQPHFDNMGGAVALREKIEKRAAAKATADASSRRRAHTEAAPATGGQGGRQVSAQDVKKMTRAEFESFTESLRNQRRGRADDEYDSLIR